MQGILVFASGKKLQAPQQEARSKYLPIIAAFIARHGVSEQKIEDWSRVILKAWVAHVRATWPGIARRHLREAFAS